MENISSMIRELIDPYVPECRYLKEANATYPEMEGRFEIPHPFYCVETGHFNYVESGLCLNQLAYVGFAYFIDHGDIESVGKISKESSLEVQAKKSFVVKADITFRRPIDPQNFRGSIKIVGKPRKMGSGTIFFPTEFSFRDHHEGNASGTALLALSLGACL
jgi:FcoT-like thioesterase domain